MPYSSGVAGKLGPGGASGGPYVSPPPGAGANGRAPINTVKGGPSVGVNGTRMAAAATKVPWWQNLLGKANLFTNIALNLTGDSSRTNKWKRLGYKSQEQYDEAMRAYELKTGKSSATGAPLTQDQITALKPPKSVVENPNDDWADPIAGRGPKGNEVGVDYAPSEPGIQGSGDPKSVGSNPWAIWANKYKGLAEKVKPGQAGYEEIQIALGKTPQNPYTTVGDFKIGDKDVSEVYQSDIELKSDIAPITDDFKVNYNTAPKGYTAGNSDLLYASASAFQQPNFDGSLQPIGGNTPEKPQPVQDFTNANTNPAEVGGYMGHPLSIKPSPEAEAANAEYGAMKFEFDPTKNMMIRVK